MKANHDVSLEDIAVAIQNLGTYIDAQLQHLEEKIEQQMDNKLSALEQRINRRFDRLEAHYDKRFDRIDARLKRIETRQDEIAADVRELFERVQKIEKTTLV